MPNHVHVLMSAKPKVSVTIVLHILENICITSTNKEQASRGFASLLEAFLLRASLKYPFSIHYLSFYLI